MIFRKATISDVDELSNLISSQNIEVSAEYLKAWYWDNPFQSHSIIICADNDQIKGVSSTNNFLLKMGEDQKLVSFPQKVLTSEDIRGQGYFSKLYFRNEKDNLESEGTSFFLTFTNHLSTPIFLKKFAYQTGVCPTIALLPPLLFPKLKGITFEVVEHFDDNYLDENELCNCPNGIVKDKLYLNWRYNINRSTLDNKSIKVAVLNANSIIGYAVLKKGVKKKIPFFYLLDIVTHNSSNIPLIIKIARVYASRQYSFGIMVFVNELTSPHLKNITLKLLLKNKLNFLVKGKTPEATNRLANINFNFSFGDLDFI